MPPPTPPPPPGGDPPEGELTRFLNQFRAGGWTTRDLFVHAHARFQMLARRILRRDFPQLCGEVETNDVLNQAYAELDRALCAKGVEQPKERSKEQSKELLGLVARIIRHNLIDLARRFRRKPAAASELDRLPGGADAPSDLAQLTEFHETVEKLRDDLRDVVELVVYHGLTQADVAKELGINERKVRRLWLEAGLRLGPHLKGGGA